MIQLRDLSKKYGQTTVLDIAELHIPKGQCFGLVGNNGAGKTTLFNLILDLIRATTGTVHIKDIDVQKSEGWKPFLAAFIDESFLIGYLTAEEYFYFIGDLRNQTKEEIDKWLLQFENFFAGEVLGKNKYIRDLSKGNQKKAGIVGALIGNPEAVVLDEPFANLDPSSQIQLKELIAQNAAKNETTYLISSHDLSHVTDVCNRIVLLEKGLIIEDIKTTKTTLKKLETYFSNQKKG